MGAGAKYKEVLDGLVVQYGNNVPGLATVVNELKKVVGDEDDLDAVMDKTSMVLVDKLLNGTEEEHQATSFLIRVLVGMYQEVIEKTRNLRGLLFFVLLSSMVTPDKITSPGGLIGLSILINRICSTLDEAAKGTQVQAGILNLNVSRNIYDLQRYGIKPLMKIARICEEE